MYPGARLHIAGCWRPGKSGRVEPILDPATEQAIGQVDLADREDLDDALASAARGFAEWRRVSAHERARILRRAADLLRQRVDDIAPLITAEQGKPLVEARGETLLGAEIIEWFAEEGRRTYGWEIPARATGVRQFALKEPVGPVAAFTPWNFPINQAVRKLSGALAAGCSIILKAPEETPASCAALVQAFLDAGAPPDTINLVFGVPSEISEYLIPSPVIRKITFTGSTAVGKHLAALAGRHMKRATMELGGHAPVIICEDADADQAVRVLGGNKFRNAGQACISPTRFLVHESVYDQFQDSFVVLAEGLKIGPGADPETAMGPLANPRRIDALEALVADARSCGATVATGGQRVGNRGYFFQPTVLTDVPAGARIMNEEPFGPVALLQPFARLDDAIEEANRLDFGLGAYAYTRSAATAQRLIDSIETGMLGINHHGLALPETPFGGVKDSGYGSEGGREAIEAYLSTKFVSHLALG